MIVEFFASCISGFTQWLNGMWGGYTLDAPWLESFDDQMDNLLDQAQGLGIWIDWNTANNVVGLVIGTYCAGFVVKLALRIVSHFTGGGGAA